jgi:hypothetical protein
MSTKKKRTYNIRLIRRDYSYEIGEIVELFRLHPNSVRMWLKQGLPTIDGRRPTLIHGSELISFLGCRQTDRRKSCQPGEFFCCRCREPRAPWESVVDIEIRDERRLLLKGICEACEAPINRLGLVEKIDEYRSRFNIQTMVDRRLAGIRYPALPSF